MNGAHDLGGKHGFGPIDLSREENFEHEWEASVFSLTLACGLLGQWNLDQSRFARESMDPAHYLASSYYEHWLHGLELLLLQRGLVTEGELRSGRKERTTDMQAVTSDKLQAILATGGPTLLPADSKQQFELGDRVSVKHDNPRTHTRAPAYVKGKTGVVFRYHGAHIFADEHSNSGEKVPAHLYTVCFQATELWGENNTEGRSAVYLDLFEPYLLDSFCSDNHRNGDEGNASK
ncbi:nitrile hydratase subunit beta [Chromatiales bacterium (ex Bugula neritina AB1)]|nr:nitrile hydratase subunit beta [Chromatiales bacterium (ex Bugula neritina AB1)]